MIVLVCPSGNHHLHTSNDILTPLPWLLESYLVGQIKKAHMFQPVQSSSLAYFLFLTTLNEAIVSKADETFQRVDS